MPKKPGLEEKRVAGKCAIFAEAHAELKRAEAQLADIKKDMYDLVRQHGEKIDNGGGSVDYVYKIPNSDKRLVVKTFNKNSFDADAALEWIMDNLDGKDYEDCVDIFTTEELVEQAVHNKLIPMKVAKKFISEVPGQAIYVETVGEDG